MNKTRKRPVNLRLKAAIVEAGKTMGEVAEAIGTPASNFSKKINGYVRFNEEEIEQIALLLNKAITDIFFTQEVTNRITKAV